MKNYSLTIASASTACFLLLLTIFATFPMTAAEDSVIRIEMGTFQLVNGSDPFNTYEQYSNFPNLSFTGVGFGTWGGVVTSYEFEGVVSQSKCTTLDNGDVRIRQYYWSRDNVSTLPNMVTAACAYRTYYKDQENRILAQNFRGNGSVGLDFVPGECPETPEEAVAGQGLEWMTEGVLPEYTKLWTCIDGDCEEGEWDCSLLVGEEEPTSAAFWALNRSWMIEYGIVVPALVSFAILL